MPGLRMFGLRRGRARLVGTLTLAVLVVVGAACQQQAVKGPPPPPPSQYCHSSTPTNAAGYQAAFDGLRAANAGLFVAADGGIPFNLGGNRILWFFGDTVLGRWQPGGPVNPFWGLDSNTWVLQTGNCFTPRREPIPDPAPNEWVWPTGAVIEGGALRVIGFHMRKTGDGPLDFDFRHMGVYTYSLSTLNLQAVNSLPVPKSPDYGRSVFTDSVGGYVYAYGRTQTPQQLDIKHYVARVPIGQLFSADAWEYWHDDFQTLPPDPLDGVGVWKTRNQADPADADPMWFDPDGPGVDPGGVDHGPLAGFPVTPNTVAGAGYLGSALGADWIAPADLLTWHADLPEGPWAQDQTPAADPTGYSQGMHTYGGSVVLGLINTPIALWSWNHDSFDAVLADPTRYRVQFADVTTGSLTRDPPPGP